MTHIAANSSAPRRVKERCDTSCAGNGRLATMHARRDRAFATCRLSKLLSGPPESESDPDQAGDQCCERRPQHDETYESVPKPSASAEPTEEKTDRFTKAPALGGRGRPGWVRPVRPHPPRRCSYARRERIERFDHLIKRVSKRFAKVGRRWCVDRVLRTPAQLRLRFGGLRRCS